MGYTYEYLYLDGETKESELLSLFDQHCAAKNSRLLSVGLTVDTTVFDNRNKAWDFVRSRSNHQFDPPFAVRCKDGWLVGGWSEDQSDLLE